jgi:CMP-N,N'-diacetyllegionaminic acid synthase
LINSKSVLAVIPARGGSKGIPGKNILKVNGKPLLAWTIEEAKLSKYIDRLILSSDDENIINVAKYYNCEVPFRRPPSLSTDSTGSVPVVIHAMDVLDEKYDYVVLLQVTSPLRTSSDIDECIERCEKYNVPACVSLVECDKHPSWMFSLDEEKMMLPLIDQPKFLIRRQDAPTVFVLNGAVYVARSKWIRNNAYFISQETMGYVMPRDRSIDIDTPADLQLLKFMVDSDRKLNKNNY